MARGETLLRLTFVAASRFMGEDKDQQLALDHLATATMASTRLRRLAQDSNAFAASCKE
jgi:hypothetical protein